MQFECVRKLNRLRRKWGKPLSPASARRCKEWNLVVGGAQRSQHLAGNACDFLFKDTADVALFADLAAKSGFLGIGTGLHLVHIDDRKSKARWKYNYIIADGDDEMCES